MRARSNLHKRRCPPFAVLPGQSPFRSSKAASASGGSSCERQRFGIHRRTQVRKAQPLVSFAEGRFPLAQQDHGSRVIGLSWRCTLGGYSIWLRRLFLKSRLGFPVLVFVAFMPVGQRVFFLLNSRLAEPVFVVEFTPAVPGGCCLELTGLQVFFCLHHARA